MDSKYKNKVLSIYAEITGKTIKNTEPLFAKRKTITFYTTNGIVAGVPIEFDYIINHAEKSNIEPSIIVKTIVVDLRQSDLLK